MLEKGNLFELLYFGIYEYPFFFLSKSHWPDSHPLTIIFKSVITFALLFLFFLIVGVLLCPWACVCMLRNAHPCTRTHAYTLAHPHTRTCTHTRLSRRLFYSMMCHCCHHLCSCLHGPRCSPWESPGCPLCVLRVFLPCSSCEFATHLTFVPRGFLHLWQWVIFVYNYEIVHRAW